MTEELSVPSGVVKASLNLTADPSADVYQRLLRERIIFLGTQVDQNSANAICAQLLLLEAEDPDRDISVYINSPGGSVTDGLAIYDTIQYVRCDVSTICLGLAASMGQFLLCAGTPGKRYALPHARILMHQPSGQMQGQAADIAIQAEQIVYLKRMMAERIAFHTGQTSSASRPTRTAIVGSLQTKPVSTASSTRSSTARACTQASTIDRAAFGWSPSRRTPEASGPALGRR